MYQKYKQFMQRYIDLNYLEWKLFESRLKIKTFTKEETILYQGDICRELYFINHGLARAYIVDEKGKDFTWGIFFNDPNAHMTNLYVVEYDSFLHQTPAGFSIEALEDTQIVSVHYEDVQYVYGKLKKGEHFGRLMSEAAYSYLHQRMIAQQTQSAQERFEAFMEKTPYLLEKVPQYHIATFLGITPQHLSRLKNTYLH